MNLSWAAAHEERPIDFDTIHGLHADRDDSQPRTFEQHPWVAQLTLALLVLLVLALPAAWMVLAVG